jgi:hypothetical protein
MDVDVKNLNHVDINMAQQEIEKNVKNEMLFGIAVKEKNLVLRSLSLVAIKSLEWNILVVEITNMVQRV